MVEFQLNSKSWNVDSEVVKNFVIDTKFIQTTHQFGYAV